MLPYFKIYHNIESIAITDMNINDMKLFQISDWHTKVSNGLPVVLVGKRKCFHASYRGILHS